MKEKVYNFRDSSALLEKLERGKRSNFIRESIELNMKLESANKNNKQLEIIKLINFYKGMVESYECQLNILEDNKKKLIKLKHDTEKNLEKTIKQENQIKTINQSIEEKETNEKLIKERKNILNNITLNILEHRDNKEIQKINLEYMKTLGKYKNIKQLTTDLHLYINKLQENENINNRKIFKEDIEYLKKKIQRSTDYEDNNK